MKDEPFGKLTWSSHDAWQTTVTLPYFRGFGTAIPAHLGDIVGGAKTSSSALSAPQLWRQEEAQKRMFRTQPEERPALQKILSMIREVLPIADFNSSRDNATSAQGLRAVQQARKELKEKIPLRIKPEGGDFVPKKPSPRQRDAWLAVTSRGNKLWDEVMQSFVDIYRLQHPARVHWWKAVYGTYHLANYLPKVTTAADMKKLLCPRSIIIKPHDSTTGAADIAIYFAATWNVDGVGVILRNGKLHDFCSVLEVFGTAAALSTFKHSTLGTLRRFNEKQPWSGHTRCDSFLDWQDILNEREHFHRHRRKYGHPESKLRWEFASGTFPIKVHAAPWKSPTEKQATALRSFLADEVRNVAAVKQAVFQRYLDEFQAMWKPWLQKHPGDVKPALSSLDDLRDAAELFAINIYPPKKGTVELGFEFLPAWTYHGVGVRWKNGKITSVGTSADLK